MNVYVALLRGINVGGSNLIRMPVLKACFEAQGLRDVSTYIQSGNVLFTTGRSNQQALTSQIEKVLSKTFAYRSRVVVRSFEQMKAIVEAAPMGFGARPTAYRYDVIFLKHPLTADEALKSITAKPGVDRVFAGNGVLYPLPTDQQGRPEPPESRRRYAGLSGHDDPQLEHDRQASRADGAGHLGPA